MSQDFNEDDAKSNLESGYEDATEVLKDPDKTELLLQRIEKKLHSIPKVGEALSSVPILISMVRRYIKKEYTSIPLGSIIAALSALIYFMTPIDVIPDFILGFGYVDDAFVIGVCLKMINTDLKKYIEWRRDKGEEIDIFID